MAASVASLLPSTHQQEPPPLPPTRPTGRRSATPPEPPATGTALVSTTAQPSTMQPTRRRHHPFQTTSLTPTRPTTHHESRTKSLRRPAVPSSCRDAPTCARVSPPPSALSPQRRRERRNRHGTSVPPRLEALHIRSFSRLLSRYITPIATPPAANPRSSTCPADLD